MILLGDSITAWNPVKGVVNLGVPGDTTRDILWRLEEIEETHGDEICLMAGVNDVIMGFSREKALENFSSLIWRLKKRFRRVTVISILPIDNIQRNERIECLNREIEKISAEARAEYLDIHSEFMGKDGRIDPRYTTDGIHLSTKGYELLNNKLNLPLLREVF